MLCVCGAPVDVICDVGINAGIIDCFPHLCLHLFHPLVGSVEVCKGMVKVFWGETHAVSLQENMVL